MRLSIAGSFRPCLRDQVLMHSVADSVAEQEVIDSLHRFGR